MPSPFPGMDPYLEGYLWPDVHNALASKIRQLLTPLLRPRYTARLGLSLVLVCFCQSLDLSDMPLVPCPYGICGQMWNQPTTIMHEEII